MIIWSPQDHLVTVVSDLVVKVSLQTSQSWDGDWRVAVNIEGNHFMKQEHYSNIKAIEAGPRFACVNQDQRQSVIPSFFLKMIYCLLP